MIEYIWMCIYISQNCFRKAKFKDDSVSASLKDVSKRFQILELKLTGDQ